MTEFDPPQTESERDRAQPGATDPQSPSLQPDHSDETLGEDIPWARPVYVAPCPDADPMLLRGSTRWAALADLGRLVVLLVGALLLVERVILALPGRFGLPLDPQEFDRAMIVVGTLMQAMFCCAAVAFIVRHRRQSAASLGLSGRLIGRNVAIGVATVGVIFGTNYVAIMLIYVLEPSLIDQLHTNRENLRNLIPKMHPVEFFVLTVVVSFYEELVVRGFILPRLRRWLGSWVPAVLLSAAIFAIPHLLQQEPFPVCLLGLMAVTLSLVTIWRRSLVPAMTAHLLFNFCAFVSIFYLS